MSDRSGRRPFASGAPPMSRREGARRDFAFGPIAPIAAFWRCSHIGETSVVVVPYNPDWEIAFGREAKAIRGSLPDLPIVLHHIGSTAIPGILAKPIIDMLGAVDHLEGLDQRSARIADLGYEVMGPFGIEGRRYFRKFDATGRRTHHLHVFAKGSRHIERHLAFRDYLRSNPLKAAEYSELKAKITSGQAGSWDDYMDAKEPFITETEEAAVAWYRLKGEPG